MPRLALAQESFSELTDVRLLLVEPTLDFELVRRNTVSDPAPVIKEKPAIDNYQNTAKWLLYRRK